MSLIRSVFFYMKKLFPYKLNLYSQLKEESQLIYIDRIKSDIMDYNYLIQIILNNDNSDFSKSSEADYDDLLKLFTDKIKS